MITLTTERALEIFRETGSLQDGHFLLTSGLHSDQFLLMPQISQHSAETEELCAALAAQFDGTPVDTVIGPATGGIILAYEMARQLGLRRGGRRPRAIFAEKVEGGKMALRRQWTLQPGERVLVVEDAVTTGGSIFKALDAISGYDYRLVGVGCIVDRSGGKVEFPAPFRALVDLPMEAWAPAECPLCRAGVPLHKPKG